ncbi:autotransporter-associated beta strand repeat-containing protein [Oleiharenicola lentus]|uniref:autotransporter-associated beta strand repeat-containing protein n=1 Tax=Oleiharenicola lentus TaxID=2508720 RepID=UPI003F664847
MTFLRHLRFSLRLIGFAGLLAFTSAARAQFMINSGDECVPSPEDGIFCGEDPGGFELFGYLRQTIHGEVTEPWYVSGNVGNGFSYNHIGIHFLVFDYTLTEGSRLTIAGSDNMQYRGTIQGAGSLRLLAGGSLLFDPTGSFVYQQVLAPYGTYYSRNTYSGGTEIEGGWLKIHDDASLGSGALALSAGGTLQTLAAGALRGFSISGHDTLLRADADLSIDGAITGDGRFNKSGAGIVTLTQTNSHTGGTHIVEGRLVVSTDANFGASDTRVSLANNTTLILGDGFISSARELALQGATANVSIDGTASWNGTTSGSAQLVKQGAGTLVLAGGIGHTGGANLTAGKLEVAVSAALNGTGTTTWSGPISGSGELIKSGGGTLVLSGAATHTGFTTVTGGTLRLGANHALSASSALFLNNDATLDLAGHHQIVGDLDSYNFTTGTNDASTVILGGATLTNLNRVANNWAGALTGTGTFIKQGAETMHWSGANTFTGTLQIDAGTLETHATNTLSPHASVALASDTVLKLNNTSQTIAGLSGSGEIRLGWVLAVEQASDTTYSGDISGSDGTFVKTGSGTLTLTGHNTFSGDLYLSGGTVRVGSNGALGQGARVFFNGGMLATTASFTTDRNHYVGATGGTFDTATATTLTSNGSLFGSGTLTKTGTGTLALTGTSTFSGPLQIEAGTVLMNGVANASAFTVNNGAALGGSGNIGALTLNSGSTLAPGNSPGTLSITGNSTWNGGANYEWEINNATGVAGTHYDLVSVSGSLTITATSENKFTLTLGSLLANNTRGDALNFNSTVNSSYTIASTTGGIIGFDASAFTINSSGFTNATNGGSWNLALGNSNRDLLLNFTAASAIPEPSTYAALAGACALGLVIYRKRSLRKI